MLYDTARRHRPSWRWRRKLITAPVVTDDRQLTVAFVNPHRWGDVKAKVLIHDPGRHGQPASKIQDGTGSQPAS